MDIINGKPTGSVRVSFGYMSTLKDAKTFVSFVESNFQHSTETSSDDLIDRPSTNFIGRKTDDVIVKDDVGDGRGLEVETVEKRGREGRWIKVGEKVAIVSSNTTGEPRRQDSERRKRDKRDKREELWEMREHLISFSLTPSVYRYCL